MVVVPLSKPANDSPQRPELVESESMNWIGFAAGGTLVTAGLLLLAGERRAGMVAAASGTALAMLDQQETLRSWWNALPTYIDQVQGFWARCRIRSTKSPRARGSAPGAGPLEHHGFVRRSLAGVLLPSKGGATGELPCQGLFYSLSPSVP